MNKPFIPCRNCDKGYIYYKDESGIDSVKICNCLQTHRNQKLFEIKFTQANLSEDIRNYDMNVNYLGDDLNQNLNKLNKFIDHFDTHFYNKHLYLWGPYGTQKTTLSKYLCKALIQNNAGNKTAYYTLADELLKKLTQIRDDNLEKWIEEIINVDLLVIDEFSAEKVCIFQSNYQISFLTSFLKKRLEMVRKSTIFVSNENIKNDESFLKKFGPTITDLIQREIMDILYFNDNYQAESNRVDIDDPNLPWNI